MRPSGTGAGLRFACAPVCVTAVFVIGCLAYIVMRRRRQGCASQAALWPGAARTTGTIVSVQTRSPELRSPEGPLLPLNFPVVRFQDAAGQLVTFQSSIGWTRTQKAGQSVKVSYDPADPQHARLDGHEGRSFHVGASIALVFLAIIVVAGLAVAAFLYQAVQH